MQLAASVAMFHSVIPGSELPFLFGAICVEPVEPTSTAEMAHDTAHGYDGCINQQCPVCGCDGCGCGSVCGIGAPCHDVCSSCLCVVAEGGDPVCAYALWGCVFCGVAATVHSFVRASGLYCWMGLGRGPRRECRLVDRLWSLLHRSPLGCLVLWRRGLHNGNSATVLSIKVQR